MQGVDLGHLIAGIACSNPAGVTDVCLSFLYVVLSCVSRGLCDKLIPRPKESYPVFNKTHKPKKGASENVDRRSNPKKSRTLRNVVNERTNY
jgi:hypothetical protein